MQLLRRTDGRRQSADGAERPCTETVTVTAEAPLINTTTAQSGRQHRSDQQVQELPVQGRNWMALAMLAPGSRMTQTRGHTDAEPRRPQRRRAARVSIQPRRPAGDVGAGLRQQPRYSQESIGEFQFISNRFDATMGRSAGVQVKAITKSGTNRFSGSVRGNFRNSRFNAPEPGASPRRADRQPAARLHAWRSDPQGSAAFLRASTTTSGEPKTSIWNTPYPQLQRGAERPRDE